MAVVYKGGSVTLTLFMFVCGAISFGIPPEFRATENGRALSYQIAVLRLEEDGRKTCNSGAETGVCYNPLNCLQVAGVFGNNCPGARGVCCLFHRQCGQRSSQEVSYFQNDDEGAGSGCSYSVVKRSSRYCGMRVNLEQLELPADCQTSIHIEGISNETSIGRLSFPERQSAGESADAICSTEAGKEYQFEIRNLDEVRFKVESSGGKSGRWKIKVTQLLDCVASEHSSHIPAIWPPPIITHPPSHFTSTQPSKPSTPPTTERPTSATCWWNCKTTTKRPTPPPIQNPQGPHDPPPRPQSSSYSQCGIKGPNQGMASFRTNSNDKPFIEDMEWGNPSRNESDFVDILEKRKDQLAQEDPFGIPNITPRITYGKPSGPMEYPWQVGMKVRGRFHCGASIIGDQYILTAAHCVTKYKRSPSTLYLTLGDYDLSTSHEQPNYVPKVERVTVHPAYSRTTLRNDLAVLKLKDKITFSANIRPICLPPAGFDTTRKIAIVTGWGRDENNRLQSKLHELASEVNANSYCGGQWVKNGAPQGFITNDMMCMSPIGGDSCNGDSGGPSVIDIGGIHHQIGIVSFGSGSCVDKDLPGVYTRVTSYLGWIRAQMN